MRFKLHYDSKKRKEVESDTSISNLSTIFISLITDRLIKQFV